ncbi:MAG: response regulator transcription factor [Clostridia bacterium]|nr:response regulator transcription factor [Clostridia bacterium]
MSDIKEAKIMIIEDDDDIREVVKMLLEKQGYKVEEAANGISALTKIDSSVDLIILDVMMPGLSGIEVCKQVRMEYNVPILFLTAKATEDDKAEGLLAGGDDYLTKPFSETELVARVTALLRRYQQYRGKPETSDEETFLTAGDLKVSDQFNAVWKGGEEISLTDIEYRILHLLMTHPNRVFSIKTIYETIWNEPYFYSSNNTVMVHMRKLRKKIEDSPESPKYIRTEWGRGYKFSK